MFILLLTIITCSLLIRRVCNFSALLSNQSRTSMTWLTHHFLLWPWLASCPELRIRGLHLRAFKPLWMLIGAVLGVRSFPDFIGLISKLFCAGARFLSHRFCPWHLLVATLKSFLSSLGFFDVFLPEGPLNFRFFPRSVVQFCLLCGSLGFCRLG